MDNTMPQINIDLLMFFDKMPKTLPLYEAVADKILAEFPDTKVKIQKTQISFSNRYNFAFVSLPVRKRKGWPDVCIILTFGLSRRIDHPRIEISTEPYPNRWTHHVIIQSTEEVDGQIMDWIKEAYGFSLNK
jgi:hypothetical protein